MSSSKRYLTLFVVALLAGTLTYVIAYINFPNKDWNKINEYKRIPNIRMAPPDARIDIIKGNLRDFKFSRKIKILVIGDSQTYGNEAPPESVFSHILSKRCVNYDVLNASIVDGRFDDQTRLLHQADPQNFDLIITNINPAHFSQATARAPRHLPGNATLSIHTILSIPNKTFFLKIYLGMDIWDENLKTPKDYKIGVASDYYSHLDFNRKKADFRAMTTEIKKRARHSLIFISPNLADRYSREKFAAEWNVAAFRQVAYAQCKAMAPESHCVDLSNAIAPSGFFDIVHLNDSGHAALADLLQREIEQALPKAVCN